MRASVFCALFLTAGLVTMWIHPFAPPSSSRVEAFVVETTDVPAECLDTGAPTCWHHYATLSIPVSCAPPGRRVEEFYLGSDGAFRQSLFRQGETVLIWHTLCEPHGRTIGLVG